MLLIIPGLAMLIAITPAAADPPSVSSWLAEMQPAVIRFGYDAEASRDCQRWPDNVDTALIQSGVSGVLLEGMNRADNRFSRAAITHGRADAIFDLRENRDHVCAGLTKGRLNAMAAHYMTPISEWPEHVLPRS